MLTPCCTAPPEERAEPMAAWTIRRSSRGVVLAPQPRIDGERDRAAVADAFRAKRAAVKAKMAVPPAPDRRAAGGRAEKQLTAAPTQLGPSAPCRGGPDHQNSATYPVREASQRDHPTSIGNQIVSCTIGPWANPQVSEIAAGG